jgi:hypothetical protein
VQFIHTGIPQSEHAVKTGVFWHITQMSLFVSTLSMKNCYPHLMIHCNRG